MKVLSLFSGIGAFEKALTNLGINFEIVNFSEIDKYAIESYYAVHNIDKSKNLGDISKIQNEDLPKNVDLLTYGFPCQDISVAGNQRGIKKGTRSGLLFEAERAIKVIKPKYCIAENVKNLVGKRFKKDFEELLKRLESYGYNNYWKVLNAKDYGVPQNRERVFIVSIRKDIDDGEFEFPEPFELELRLKDLLEDEVEDKYYIDNDRTVGSPTEQRLEPNTQGITNTLTTVQKDNLVLEKIACEQRTDEGLRFFKGGVVGTLRTIDSCGDKRVLELKLHTNLSGGNRQPKALIRTNTKKGYDVVREGDSINISFPNSKTRRGRVGKGVAQTLDTQCNQAVLQQYKIRKLTPLECWRLMGFGDEDYWRARKALEEKFYNGKDRSDSQMYKQAGNSIVTNVLEEIFKSLLINKEVISINLNKTESLISEVQE